MKKVIFISALAIAAAVSCTKSDIVDTKFNEQISFESYIGRDAMTKASVINTGNVGSVAVYGYYTGAEKWNGGMTANLWNPLTLTVASDGKGSIPSGQEKYWTNADDLYTFLAYAPINEKLTVTTTEDGPTLSYTVNEDIQEQIDVLYATAQVDRTKGDGNVALQMNHALSRVTVKAKDADMTDPFTFDVKEVILSGDFYTSGKIVLAEGEWSELVEGDHAYEFYSNSTKETDPETSEVTVKYGAYEADNALKADYVDYAGTDNYLMVIPTTAKATLTVKYTTYYEKKESNLITKTFDITTGFEEGKAYSINLNFDDNASQITFTVAVNNWDDVAADEDDNEFDDGDEETTIEGGNPENSTNWTEVTNNGGAQN